MIDVVQLVRENKCKFEFVEILSEHNGYKLYIKVFRDGMKFFDVPALEWNFKQTPGDSRIFQGVRLPASAEQLQQIADLLSCMLMTPKVIDLTWMQAKIKFDAVTTTKGGKIVATSKIHDVHEAIEAKITALGGDNETKLVSSDGKYWCLTNDLLLKPKAAGDYTCCNYGWYWKKASGPGIDPNNKEVSVWQRPGYAHNKKHWDPSQTIRLMYRIARLVLPDGTEHKVDLHNVAADQTLAPLLHHQPGILKCLRQPGVPEQNPIFTREQALDNIFSPVIK